VTLPTLPARDHRGRLIQMSTRITLESRLRRFLQGDDGRVPDELVPLLNASTFGLWWVYAAASAQASWSARVSSGIGGWVVPA
jgi:hypothetical protein